MNSRFAILGFASLVLVGCGAAVGAGGGGGGVSNLASVRVKSTSSELVQQAVFNVFTGDGFEVISSEGQSYAFSKQGGRSADIMWSTMANPNPVMIHPTVKWQPSGSDEILVTCQVQIIQQSTVQGSVVRQPLLMGKSAYNKLLKDVRNRAEGKR
jgi:hypothetical protein